MSATTTAIGFVPFATSVLRVALSPGQRVHALVAFDGVHPCELSGSDRELARRLFGFAGRIPPSARAIEVTVAGARAGKSYLRGLRLLHLALTVPLRLAPGERASAVFVAPDMRLARQGLRYALGAVQGTPSIARLLEDEAVDGFTLRRPDGHPVRLEALPATRGGSALRGRSLVGAVLDETAFFRGDDSVVNDVEVFRAVSARVVPGGQVSIVSTPWAESGLLFDLFTANHGKPTTAVAAHAPTLLMRDDAKIREMVERERITDPDNAAREFDAEFMAAGTDRFFDAAAVDACVDRSRPLNLEPRAADATGVGADFAFRSDSSALAVVFREGTAYSLATLDEMRPTRGAPLQPSAVVGRFAGIARAYGRTSVVADGHYREAIAEHLATHGLTLEAAPEGQGGKATTYLRLRTLINEGRMTLPNHARLIAQLKAVTSKATPGGGLTISSPRSAAGHGDLVSALVLAAWRADQGAVSYSAVRDGFSAPRSAVASMVPNASMFSRGRAGAGAWSWLPPKD